MLAAVLNTRQIAVMLEDLLTHAIIENRHRYSITLQIQITGQLSTFADSTATKKSHARH